MSFNCWHRFDQNFQPSPPPPTPYAHLAITYPSSLLSPSPPTPYPSLYPYAPARIPSPASLVYSHSSSLATPNSVADLAWYPDSRASSHVTPEFQNLMNSSTYHGADQLHVGNGQGLNISHISNSNIILSHSSSRTLRLHDLLYVPSITKNLVTISKLARDN